MLSHTSKTLEWNNIKQRLEELCFSYYGKKQIQKIKVLRSVKPIEKHLEDTLEMKTLLSESSFPSYPIESINEELERAKIENSVLFTDELYKIAEFFKASREIRIFLNQIKERFPLLAEHAANISSFKSLEDAIFKAIDPDMNLSDNASPQLKSIRQEIRTKRNSISKRLQSFVRNQDHAEYIQDEVVTLRENRFVIPIKRDHKGKIKGIVLDTSNSGETLFIEPEYVVEDNNRLIALFKEEKDEEIRILKYFTSQIREQLDVIYSSIKSFSFIDFIYAKGRLALEMNASLPEINDQGIYKLFKAYHPMLKGDVVPIDLFLGEDFHMLIITGPNTGGKTVALKTLGLLSMMACAGLMIPAQEGSIVSTNDMIFIDSGDEQSIHQNLSTFSAHIKRIIQIMKHATKNSLVLIDEIGSGTDPEEGSNLALAILDQLRKIQCKCMITTHYAKLKSYYLQNERVQNASTEFDLDTLMPRYKLIYGLSGKSNALDIAKRLGLNQEIIENAYNRVQSGTSDNEKIINSAQEEKGKAIEISEMYEKKFKELSLKESELKVREDLLKREQKELKKKQTLFDQQSISETRKKLLNLYNEAKESLHNSQDLEKVKASLKSVQELGDEEKAKLNNLSDNKPYRDTSYEWQIGDQAYLESMNKIGTIHSISKKSVTIQLGDLKIRTDLNDLMLPPNQERELNDNKKVSTININVTSKSAPYELQLLGLRGDDAVRETEMYIETLYTSNRDKGRIVHGKGTGILRSLIEDVLKKHPHVKSFSLAKPEDGGYGVTEVLIK